MASVKEVIPEFITCTDFENSDFWLFDLFDQEQL